MTPLYIDYLLALGEARSCLAALADAAPTIEESAHFDRLLIELDGITGDTGPACFPMVGAHMDLVSRLERSVDRLIEYGVDRLSLELLLVSASCGLAPWLPQSVNPVTLRRAELMPPAETPTPGAIERPSLARQGITRT